MKQEPVPRVLVTIDELGHVDKVFSTSDRVTVCVKDARAIDRTYLKDDVDTYSEYDLKGVAVLPYEVVSQGDFKRILNGENPFEPTS